MGSHWFSNCDVISRFSRSESFPLTIEGGERWVVWDWDQRRSLDVYIPDESLSEEFIFEAVSKFMEGIPRHVTRVDLDAQGALVSTSSDPRETHAWVGFYPLRTEYPRRVATVRREHLTEVDRLGLQVDLVSYSPRPGETRQAVFKYYISNSNNVLLWHEAKRSLRCGAVADSAYPADRLPDVLPLRDRDRVPGPSPPP